jgi:hypothetical protein
MASNFSERKQRVLAGITDLQGSQADQNLAKLCAFA